MVVPAGDAALDVLLELDPLLRVLEAGEQLRRAALVRPRRDDARQVVVTARVGVDVRADVDAALAGAVDQLDDLAHPPPIALIGDLDMEDFHRDAGAAA